MASKIAKTKPMEKTENPRPLTMKAIAEIQRAQITAFGHGILWAVAETIWNHFSEEGEDFEHSNIGHWQGAGYKIANEFATWAKEGLKVLPALVVKNLTSGFTN